MRNVLAIIYVLFLFMSCDDGDIITVNLEFEQDLELCENTDSYLIFDTRDDPSESLSFLFPISGNGDVFPMENDFSEEEFEDLDIAESKEISINTSTNRFNYRTYNRAIATGELCDLITPSDLIILEDYQAESGNVVITTTFVDDDNDGVPTEFELDTDDADGDGNPFTNPKDTDLDGIPDYLDQDDDNDNVLTRNELNDDDVDDDPFTNPLNTDLNLPNGDDIPDYLDPDDDGDGTPTRLEDEDGDENPRNDSVIDSMGNSVLRYLSNEVNELNDDPELGLIDNTYTRTYTYLFIVNNVDLEIISTDIINLGTFAMEIRVTRVNDD